MEPAFIHLKQGENSRNIAVRQLHGNSPGLVWLGGYRSDMLGSKASALEAHAKLNGLACCRHDYSGHGESESESGGVFMEGTISRWLEESLAVFDKFTSGPQILVCSSMGAWIGLRMVQELIKRGDEERLHGLLLLAPAPDFTHELMLPELSEKHKSQLEERGFMEEPSQYSDEPNIYTKKLFDDAEINLVMGAPVETRCPVHIIQGMRDEDVPYQHAMRLLTLLPGENVTMTLVKDGDHRLSRPQDIDLMLRAVDNLVKSK